MPEAVLEAILEAIQKRARRRGDGIGFSMLLYSHYTCQNRAKIALMFSATWRGLETGQSKGQYAFPKVRIRFSKNFTSGILY